MQSPALLRWASVPLRTLHCVLFSKPSEVIASESPCVHVGSLANSQCEFRCCQLHRGWPFSSFSTNV